MQNINYLLRVRVEQTHLAHRVGTPMFAVTEFALQVIRECTSLVIFENSALQNKGPP